jgi:putative ABC transport system permease protein
MRKSQSTSALFLTHGAAGSGCVIGIVGCLTLLRMIRSLLFAVSPTDPLVFGGTCMLLIIVALVATWLPARRALSINPIEAPGSGTNPEA